MEEYPVQIRVTMTKAVAVVHSHHHQLPSPQMHQLSNVQIHQAVVETLIMKMETIFVLAKKSVKRWRDGIGIQIAKEEDVKIVAATKKIVAAAESNTFANIFKLKKNVLKKVAPIALQHVVP
mmetsp:Transcript_12098/g.13917  ORF Transcript_12098/g.13917 Transcript_12098/m.13917 type:complete len:122 (+) Transcript_12098:1410-1775(+)